MIFVLTELAILNLVLWASEKYFQFPEFSNLLIAVILAVVLVLFVPKSKRVDKNIFFRFGDKKIPQMQVMVICVAVFMAIRALLQSVVAIQVPEGFTFTGVLVLYYLSTKVLKQIHA